MSYIDLRFKVYLLGIYVYIVYCSTYYYNEQGYEGTNKINRELLHQVSAPPFTLAIKHPSSLVGTLTAVPCRVLYAQT
jgi:hypothetical protein